MQDAQSHLLNLAEEHQHAFETEIVENANRWMEYQRKNFCKLAMSDQMIRQKVEALEQAAAQGYSIDAENDVVINAAPAIPLAIEPPSHYAAEVAACMINEKYEPSLNEMGGQFIAQQEQLAELQKQVAEAHERRTPLEVAFSEVFRSRGTTPVVKNLRPSSRPLRITKSSSISSGDHRDSILLSRHLRRLSPQPLPHIMIVDGTCPSGSGTKNTRDSYRTRTPLCGSRAHPSTHHPTSPTCLWFGNSTTCTSKACG